MEPTNRRVPGVADVHAAAFRTSPVLTCVLAGPDLTVLAVNPAVHAWLGNSVPVGASLREALVSLAGRQLVSRIERVRDTGVSSTHEAWRLEGTRPDGTSQELVADVLIEPWRQAGLAGVVLHLVDIAHHLPGSAAGLDALAPMQDALIPADVPIVPGMSVAARYLLAGSDGRAGGDWFDVLPRGDRLVMVVGDVIGQGTGGAAVMSSLQAVLRERLLAGTPVAEAVAALDAFAVHTADAAGATVGVVELDPASGELDYVLAGHPPPLVVDAGGGFRFLPPLGGRPLASRGSFQAGQERLGEDELLLLYSDGLVERRDRDSTEGPVELARVASAAFAHARDTGAVAATAERTAAALLDGLVQRSGHRDDVALVVGSRSPAAPDLALDLAGRPEDATDARTELTTWLTTLGARLVDRVTILHAFDEVLRNATSHGLPEDPEAPKDVRVRAHLAADGVVDISVADRGRWRTPPAETRGRGLMVAGSLVDGIHVECGETGSTVSLRQRLTRQVEMLELPPAPPDAPPFPAYEEAEVTEIPGGVCARGALDGEVVAELRLALLRATQAGCRDAIVDLTDATYVGGAAVSVLFDAHARCEDHGVELSVVAAPGSPAQHVLDVVALPWAGGQDAGLDPRFA